VKEYLKSTMEILEHSVNSIDEEVFEKLVCDSAETLRRHNKLIVSGLGKNVPVCEKFVGTMNSFGLDASFMNTNSAMHGDLGLIHKGDLVIILTKSGETIESIYLNQMLEKRDCVVWLFTFQKDSTLGKKIPKVLAMDLEHEGDKWNIVPNNSTTMNLIVLQTLAMRLSEEMGISLEQFKRNHPGGHIGEILKNV